jgi:ribosomal protein S27AE
MPGIINPFCPRCGHRFTYDEIWNAPGDFPIDDGDSYKNRCPKCGSTLKIDADFIPAWKVESLD